MWAWATVTSKRNIISLIYVYVTAENYFQMHRIASDVTGGGDCSRGNVQQSAFVLSATSSNDSKSLWILMGFNLLHMLTWNFLIFGETFDTHFFTYYGKYGYLLQKIIYFFLFYYTHVFSLLLLFFLVSSNGSDKMS